MIQATYCITRVAALLAGALLLAPLAQALPGDTHAPVLGSPGDPAKVSRTIAIDMADTMRFTPAAITVKRGETIRFVVTNVGKLEHEMVLGSPAELREHAAMMQKPMAMDMDMHHAASAELNVAPGKTAELVWHFVDAGPVDFACLEPGHFEAGMRGVVQVR